MAAFRLASHLGKTIGELDITWDEFIYWQVFFQLEPVDDSANKRTAAIMAQITNMSGKSLREGKTVTPDDFLGKPKKQSAKEQIAFFKAISKDDK